MSERLGDMPNPEIEQVKIILNTLYLCIGYALRHVARHEGEGAAYALQANMLDAIKNGDIDMARSKTGTASIWSSPRLNNLLGTIRSPSAYARILALGGARRLDPASHLGEPLASLEPV